MPLIKLRQNLFLKCQWSRPHKPIQFSGCMNFINHKPGWAQRCDLINTGSLLFAQPVEITQRHLHIWTGLGKARKVGVGGRHFRQRDWLAQRHACIIAIVLRSLKIFIKTLKTLTVDYKYLGNEKLVKVIFIY